MEKRLKLTLIFATLLLSVLAIIPFANSEKYIKVTKPNGGELFEYDYGGFDAEYGASPEVRAIGIKLLKGESTVYEIEFDTHPAGKSLGFGLSSYNYDRIGTGSDYRIMVYDKDDPSVYDESDSAFTLREYTGTLCPKGYFGHPPDSQDENAESCKNNCNGKGYTEYYHCGTYCYCNYESKAQRCKETDNGNDENTKGKIFYGDISKEDFCLDGRDLEEYYCEYYNGIYDLRSITFTCPQACADGACTGGEKREQPETRDSPSEPQLSETEIYPENYPPQRTFWSRMADFFRKMFA